MPHPYNTVFIMPADRSITASLARTSVPVSAQRPMVCTHPIRLVGERYLVDSRTGLLLDHSGEAEITVNCGNRRAAVCPHCSTLYQYDTYQLIAAGLRGGKSIHPTVAAHPRLFITLTAPSFGPVHQGPDKKSGHTRPCTPRRDGTGCFRHHRTGDRQIGTPIDPGTYDYPGHVLFNANAAVLWSCTLTEVRRALARLLGVTRRTLHRHVTVQFAKVAEYQTRSIVHFHAIARLDGPAGPSSPPPAEATNSILEQAIREAAEHTAIPIPPIPDLGIGATDIRWGEQIDIRPISARTTSDGRSISDAAVARYIAKYATKSAESAGIQLPPLTCRQCRGTGHQPGPLPGLVRRCRTCHGTGRSVDLSAWNLTDHTRALIDTCWRLGAHPDLEHLKLRHWAHMLGFRGHFSTKSRTYSTTLAALRADRAAHAATQDPYTMATITNPDIIVINHWTYAGHADTPASAATDQVRTPAGVARAAP